MTSLTPVESGQAASYPIVTVDAGSKDAMLMGGAGRTQWLEQDRMASRIRGGERYKLYSLTTFAGESIGGKPRRGEDPPDGDQFYVPLRKPVPGKSDLVGIAGPWNALPRTPRIQRNSKVYEPIIAEFLRKKGIRRPDVRIKQIIRIDLEGDGTEEVLIAADNLHDPPRSRAEAGHYSLVLMRQVRGRAVHNLLVRGSFFLRADPADNASAPSRERIRSVLDLNGDGTLEVLLDWQYYEGSGTYAYEITPGKANPVLGNGVGV